MMNSVALLIGGNQSLRRSRPAGATCLSRHALIDQATALIRERIGTVVALSAVYETEPWGDFGTEDGEQKVENFLNRALLVETTLSPHEVLKEALAIEAELGRTRNPSSSSLTRIYHSRTMDIDLIFYDDLIMDTPDLTLPHPRAHLRRFVLEPLAEIIPDYRHPKLGITVKELFEQSKNNN